MHATLSRARSLRFSFDWSRLFPFLLWRDRITRNNLRDDAMSGLTGALIVLPQAVAFAFPPPAIQGIGLAGGATMVLQDRAGKPISFLAPN